MNSTHNLPASIWKKKNKGGREDKEKLKTLTEEKVMKQSEREGERHGAQKHLSSRTRQVFNLRIKTVWKFISMLMALCLSLPDYSSAQAGEEIHLKHCHNNAQWIFIGILLPWVGGLFQSWP